MKQRGMKDMVAQVAGKRSRDAGDRLQVEHLRRDSLVGDLDTHNVQQNQQVDEVMRLPGSMQQGRVPLFVMSSQPCTPTGR
jgi:hypothetical protein